MIWNRSDFLYELPAALIAQQPPLRRSDARLLSLEAGMRDARITDFPALLHPDDLLVFNDTRVIPARLFGTKESGGRVEILIERVLGGGEVLAQVRASKPPRTGGRIQIDGSAAAFEVQRREDEFFCLKLIGPMDLDALLREAGHMPLPPYIGRADDPQDQERYQTVFARSPGAVAAPTAGLHFDEPLLSAIRERGVATAYLTLHVGAGTFQPVRADNLAEHRMHAERYEISPATASALATVRARGGRVVAVGTTVVRALETAAASGMWAGETRLFITPGYRFQAVDALLTNFHLPGSTLLMLVCAFAGYERTMAAYRHAVDRGYRFFSYGDAMFIPTRSAP